MNESVIPSGNEVSASVTVEASEHGGHVGFVSGKWPWSPEYYLDKRIPEFLEQH